MDSDNIVEFRTVTKVPVDSNQPLLSVYACCEVALE